MVNPLNWYASNRVLVRGYNSALAVTMEQIGPSSLAWTLNQDYWTTVTPLQIASGSATDAAAGNGMRTCRVVGAKLDGTLQYSDFSLNGTTDATASSESYAAVYCAYGLTYGTNDTNAGIIYVFDDGATTTTGNPATPEEALIIPVGEKMASKCCFICPPSKTYQFKKMIVGAAVQPIIIELRIYSAGLTGGTMVHRFSVGSSGMYDVDLNGYDMGLNAGEMLVANALSTTAAGQVLLDIILERNN